MDHLMWAEQIEALSREFRVIAPDLRGFGKSTLIEGDADTGVGMESYTADIVGLLDAIEVREPVALAGFSMGGYVAWQFALRYPDRLRGLALCDTRAVADTEEARAGRIKMAEAALAAGDASPALGMIAKLLSAATQERRPEIVAQVRAMIQRQSHEAIAAAQRGMAVREDVTSRLAAIKIPCLCLVGAEDAISPPKEMRQIADSLPHAKFLEIPNAGHMTTVENPGAVTSALGDFFRSIQK